MMARSHALLAAAGWLALAPPVAGALGYPLDQGALAAGTVVAAGAALLPDLDHEDATAAGALGPLTRVLARGVGRLAGGHRQATHSLVFGPLMGLAAWLLVAWGGRWATLALAALCASLALQALGVTIGKDGRLEWLQVAAVALALTWLAGRLAPGAWEWLPVGVVAGCWLHTLGDMLTPGGVPLLWPSRQRVTVPLIARTNGWEEAFILAPALGVALLGLAWARFGSALVAVPWVARMLEALP